MPCIRMSSSDCSILYETPKKQRKVKVKRLQKFKNEWKSKFPWLEKDEDQLKAKCSICAITFSIDKSGIGQIKQHSEFNTHASKLKITQQSSILNNFLRLGTAEPNESKETTAAELALVYHTVKHNLSYNSADCGAKLYKLLYAESKNAKTIQLGRTKQAPIVENVLGPYALKQALTHIKDKSDFFALQIDASNRKNVKLFPLVIQYFDTKAGIQQKLLDFYENPDESADGMFTAVKDSLTRNNLSLDKIMPTM